MTKSYLICSLGLLLLSGSVYGITLPGHNCSEYFTYGFEDGNYIALFTAPKAGLSHVSWNVSFVWQGPAESPIASLQHYPNAVQAVHNINSGRHSQIIVRFKNISEQLPQLVDLQVNNERLCSNTATGHKITLTRGITATKEIKAVYNTRPEMLPIFPTIAPKMKYGVGFMRY